MKKNVIRTMIGIVIALLLLVVAQGTAALPYILLDIAGFSMNESLAKIIVSVFYPLIAWLGVYLLCNKFQHLTLRDCRIAIYKISLVGVVLGLLLPILKVVCYIAFVPGHIQTAIPSSDILLRMFAAFLGTGVAAAIVEEMIFRGAILKFLERCMDETVAVLVSSLIFGAFHIIATGYSFSGAILVLVETTCAGLFFALLTKKTGNIWTAVIAHCAWNTFEIALFPITNEAAYIPVPFSFILETDHALLTGAEGGASIITIVLTILACLFLMKWKAKENSTDNRVGIV